MRDENCALCQILIQNKEKCLANWTSDNEMGDGDWFFIYKAKNMKGHRLRYMVVVQNHEGPTVPADGYNFLFGFMRQFKKNFTILEPTHASVPNHWHLLACSNDVGTDEDLINDTDRTVVLFVQRERGLTASKHDHYPDREPWEHGDGLG